MELVDFPSEIATIIRLTGVVRFLFFITIMLHCPSTSVIMNTKENMKQLRLSGFHINTAVCLSGDRRA